MPKGKTPSMLSMGNGPISFGAAKGTSKCSRCSCRLVKGAKCGELALLKTGFKASRRLCLDCAKSIIEATQVDLDRLKQTFSKELES